MNISYIGQDKDMKQNVRCAAICFDEENTKDARIAGRIVDLAEKTTGWKHNSGFDGMWLIEVDDRKDYEDFVLFYKDAKKMFALCEKHGF
jgi:hypothetical protein